jgi:serine protease AprX
MNSMKTTTNNVLKLLTAAFLVSSFLTMGFPSGGRSVLAASSSHRSNISPDLEEAVANSPDAYVRVIIDTKPSANSNAFSKLMMRIGEMGGTVLRSLNDNKTAAVQIVASSIQELASENAVKYISLDRTTQVAGHLETTTGAAAARNYGTSHTGPIDGYLVGIAILDSGIYAAHHSLSGRVVASVDFTGEGRTDDPFGHGTHVATIAAGNSHVSSAYTGIAPWAKIINVRVLNAQGVGSISSAIAGIDWCIANKVLYNIRVLNLSLGATAVDSYVNDPLCQAVRRAFDAGLVVCVAAGNSGKDANGTKIFGAVHSPGIEPSALTVGAANTMGTDSRADDSMASFSSHGPTRGYYTDTAGVKHYDNLIKPDLIAPGNRIVEAQSPGNQIVTANPSLDANVSTSSYHEMMYMSGTSMATPAAAGAAALLLQRNPSLTPNLVKALLEYTAQPLAGVSNYEQGAGQLNIEGAVRLAGLVRTDLIGRQLGDVLLIGAPPTASTTIAGYSFGWGGGIIQKWNFIYGSALITKFQGIYGNGVLLTDGTLLAGGVLLSDGTLLSSGALLSEGVLLSDGTLLSNGVLLSDGTLLSDGVLLSDGTLLSDGVLLSDWAMASSTSSSAAQTLAMSALGGDQTSSMAAEPDSDPTN